MSSLKNIPPVDETMKSEAAATLIHQYNREYIVKLVRKLTDELRQELRKSGQNFNRKEALEILSQRLYKRADQDAAGSLRRVVNGTGVILHTNLGRAPLGKRATDYMLTMAAHYNNLEMNLEQGERGTRYHHVEALLKEITGAQAALVVNNNAAAVLLCLTTLARGKEVIVSRGQLIEIGGAFRIPEVMKLSGASLVEVGTTNRTYLQDYANAITPDTALLFTAHTSNYKVIGFTREVLLEDLVKLGRDHDIPVIQDLGSGILCHLKDPALQQEPTVQACLAAGVDIICFSGDKLLGGPQAGIILGRADYIEAMKKNQLLRALRVDKLTIAALEGTLLEYLVGQPDERIPIIHMLNQEPEELKLKARDLYDRLLEELKGNPLIKSFEVCSLEDMIGGGAYPTHKLPGFGVALRFEGVSVEEAARRLRMGDPAVVGRRQDDRLLISIRTLLPNEEALIAAALKRVLLEH